MPQIFWLNLIALFFTAIVAAALFISVLGVGLKNPLNLTFALFALTVSFSAIFNLLRHVFLWLDIGDPILLSELNFLGGLLFGPLVLMFTALYLDRRSRWVNWGVGMGLVLIAFICLPLFGHQFMTDLHLDAYGIARSSLASWRFMVALVPAVFTVWALGLFWLERHQVDNIYVALGLVIFLGGYLINGAFKPIFPVISVTTAMSIMVLGYGVVQQQLFNPLKDMTQELQQEIAERKHAESALQEERRLLRTLIDNIPGPVYAKDTESRFIVGNNYLVRSMGVDTLDDLMGNTDVDFFPEEFATQYRADELKLISSGQALLNHEEQAIEADGNAVWYSTSKIPLLNDENVVTGLVGIGLVITQRKQAEEERERLQQQIIDTQQQTLVELSNPIIPVMSQIIVAPLIGNIDAARARDMTRSLLTGITQHKARVVIIDITGVSMIDTDVVAHLNRTIQAVKLKGAQTIVTGISDVVAETIVDLGIDWSGITTLSNLQRGLIVALNALGFEIRKTT